MEPVRASDAERDQVVGELAAAAAEGRLTLDELAGRTGAALAAVHRADLAPLTADLPAPQGAAPRGRRWILGILGGGDHAGRWRVAARCVVVNVMGGADLDLRQALVEGPVTDITVVSLMGGSTITVPEGVAVDAGGLALLGGNDVRLEGPPPPEGAPVVRVRAWSLLGGTDVLSRPRPGGPGHAHARGHGLHPPRPPHGGPPPPAPPPPPRGPPPGPPGPRRRG